jgi:hypothetical protein
VNSRVSNQNNDDNDNNNDDKDEDEDVVVYPNLVEFMHGLMIIQQGGYSAYEQFRNGHYYSMPQ